VPHVSRVWAVQRVGLHFGEGVHVLIIVHRAEAEASLARDVESSHVLPGRADKVAEPGGKRRTGGARRAGERPDSKDGAEDRGGEAELEHSLGLAFVY